MTRRKFCSVLSGSIAALIVSPPALPEIKKVAPAARRMPAPWLCVHGERRDLNICPYCEIDREFIAMIDRLVTPTSATNCTVTARRAIGKSTVLSLDQLPKPELYEIHEIHEPPRFHRAFCGPLYIEAEGLPSPDLHRHALPI